MEWKQTTPPERALRLNNRQLFLIVNMEETPNKSIAVIYSVSVIAAGISTAFGDTAIPLAVKDITNGWNKGLIVDGAKHGFIFDFKNTTVFLDAIEEVMAKIQE